MHYYFFKVNGFYPTSLRNGLLYERQNVSSAVYSQGAIILTMPCQCMNNHHYSFRTYISNFSKKNTYHCVQCSVRYQHTTMFQTINWHQELPGILLFSECYNTLMQTLKYMAQIPDRANVNFFFYIDHVSIIIMLISVLISLVRRFMMINYFHCISMYCTCVIKIIIIYMQINPIISLQCHDLQLY